VKKKMLASLQYIPEEPGGVHAQEDAQPPPEGVEP
jgi:hypothetical protein